MLPSTQRSAPVLPWVVITTMSIWESRMAGQFHRSAFPDECRSGPCSRMLQVRGHCIEICGSVDDRRVSRGVVTNEGTYGDRQDLHHRSTTRTRTKVESGGATLLAKSSPRSARADPSRGIRIAESRIGAGSSTSACTSITGTVVCSDLPRRCYPAQAAQSHLGRGSP